MMFIFVINLIAFFVFLVVAMYVHELGHWIYLRKLYPKRKITVYTYKDGVRDFGLQVGLQRDYDQMNNRQYALVNIYGVSAGLIAILVMSFAINIYLLLLIVPYMFGSWHDIKEIFKAFREGLNY